MTHWNQPRLRSRLSTVTNSWRNNERSSLCFSSFSCQSFTCDPVRPTTLGPHGLCLDTESQPDPTDPGPGAARDRKQVSSACASAPQKNRVWLLLKRHFHIPGSVRTRASPPAFLATDCVCAAPNHATAALAIWLRLGKKRRGSGGHLESHPQNQHSFL